MHYEQRFLFSFQGLGVPSSVAPSPLVNLMGAATLHSLNDGLRDERRLRPDLGGCSRGVSHTLLKKDKACAPVRVFLPLYRTNHNTLYFVAESGLSCVEGEGDVDVEEQVLRLGLRSLARSAGPDRRGSHALKNSGK